MIDLKTRYVRSSIDRELLRHRIAYLYFLSQVKGYNAERINKIYLYYANKDFILHDITKSVYFDWLTENGELNQDKVWGYMFSNFLVGKRFCRRKDATRCKDVVRVNFCSYLRLLVKAKYHLDIYCRQHEQDVSIYEEEIYQ